MTIKTARMIRGGGKHSHDDEKKALPIMLAMAGVTFWLLRLNVIYYNRQQGRTGDNIMVKNPDLMKRLASFHWGKVK